METYDHSKEGAIECMGYIDKFNYDPLKKDTNKLTYLQRFDSFVKRVIDEEEKIEEIVSKQNSLEKTPRKSKHKKIPQAPLKKIVYSKDKELSLP
jgi:hypothetical protein